MTDYSERGSERWVKATTHNDNVQWVNVALASVIGPLFRADRGNHGTWITFPGHAEDAHFKESPEHFLPKKDLAVFRMFDALVEIKRGIPQSLAQASAAAHAAVEAYKEMGE